MTCGVQSDNTRFSDIVAAHDALKDPVKRAQYDIQYKDCAGTRRKLSDEASNNKFVEGDVVVQESCCRFLM
jgi:DnaJ-class molecular chaperone